MFEGCKDLGEMGKGCCKVGMFEGCKVWGVWVFRFATEMDEQKK